MILISTSCYQINEKTNNFYVDPERLVDFLKQVFHGRDALVALKLLSKHYTQKQLIL